MKQFIVGITGDINSGKDSSARFLQHITTADIYSFAEPLRRVVSHKFGVPLEELRTQEGKATFNEYWGMTHRDMLRVEGTEATRNVYKHDHWIRRAEQVIAQCSAEVVVIPDVRFLDEAEWVRANGILLHVKRIDNPRADTMSTHPSDAGIPYEEGDYEVYNNSTLSELYARLFHLVMRVDLLRHTLDNQRFLAMYAD